MVKPVSIIQQTLDLIFPEPCIHCRAVQSSPLLLCQNCLAELPCSLHHIQKPELLKQLWGLAEYSGPVGAIMRRCKYKPDIRIFHTLIDRIDFSTITWSHFDAITHIPTTPKRLFTRGFDQSQVLAQKLSSTVSIPYYPTLKRMDHYPQSRRSRYERKQNLSHRFQITKNNLPANILIVDDICTTGNTLEAAAMTLLNHGTKHVQGLVIGYS